MSFITQGKNHRKFLLIIIILTIIIVGITSSCQYWRSKVKTKRGPNYNLLIIVSDSLRADSLSCYGGEANTPNICGLAKKGVLFENAYSNASWTIPSSLSIFTGNYSNIYGNPWTALDFYIENKNKIGKHIPNLPPEELIKLPNLFRKINDNELLLAEALRNNGYGTKYKMNFSSLDFVNCCNQLQGLEELKNYKNLTEEEINFVENTTNIKNIGSEYEEIYSTLDYLLNIKEKNFFSLVWILDPHFPYSPPEKFKKNINVDFSKLSMNPEFYSSLSFSQSEIETLPNFTDYDVYYLKQLYLKEVESLDERMGYILKALEYNGLENNTFIVFTSDHGEGFGERGRFSFGHGNTGYNEMIHVPLIISGPNIVKGEIIKDNVSHIDLMPTLKDLMGVDCLYDVNGKSYKSLLVNEKDSFKQGVQYMEEGFSRALIENNYKLIINYDNSVELYDLFEDPKELNDISKNNQDIVKNMKKKLSQLRKEELIKIIKDLPGIQDKGRFIYGLLRWIKEFGINQL